MIVRKDSYRMSHTVFVLEVKILSSYRGTRKWPKNDGEGWASLLEFALVHEITSGTENDRNWDRNPWDGKVSSNAHPWPVAKQVFLDQRISKKTFFPFQWKKDDDTTKFITKKVES